MGAGRGAHGGAGDGVRMSQVQVRWILGDGEEREEHWPSVERFRAWAQAEGLHASFTAYAEDEDGEWAVVAAGRV